jgi:hypothetical protein
MTKKHSHTFTRHVPSLVFHSIIKIDILRIERHFRALQKEHLLANRHVEHIVF